MRHANGQKPGQRRRRRLVRVAGPQEKIAPPDPPAPGGAGPRRHRHRVITETISNEYDYPAETEPAAPGTPGSTGVESSGDAQAIWQRVLEELRFQLPLSTFDTWLKGTEGIADEDTALVVRVPTPFKIMWIERRLYQPLQQALERVTGRFLDITFTTHYRDPETHEPVLNSPGFDDNCTMPPCLLAHNTSEHRRNLVRYLENHWNIWDPEFQIEIWSQELIEATVQELKDIEFPTQRFRDGERCYASSYFLKCVMTVAGWTGMEDKEIGRRWRECRSLNKSHKVKAESPSRARN